MMYYQIVRVFLLCYLFGSIPSGYLIGRLNGIDIRQFGSHNIGATNVRRVLGGDWSIICFFFDFMKGFLPVVLIGHGAVAPLGPVWGGLIAAIAAVIGHVFPCWLHFKGGKGVATSLGVVIGISFFPVCAAGLTWLFFNYRTHIVAIASIAAVTAMVLCSMAMFIFSQGKLLTFPELVLFIVIALIVIICHHENIRRIRQGKENCFRK